MDYETTCFVLNAGSELIFLLVMVTSILLWAMLACILRCSNFTIAAKMKEFIASRLMWDSFIDFFRMG